MVSLYQSIATIFLNQQVALRQKVWPSLMYSHEIWKEKVVFYWQQIELSIPLDFLSTSQNKSYCQLVPWARVEFSTHTDQRISRSVTFFFKCEYCKENNCFQQSVDSGTFFTLTPHRSIFQDAMRRVFMRKGRSVHRY